MTSDGLFFPSICTHVPVHDEVGALVLLEVLGGNAYDEVLELAHIQRAHGTAPAICTG